MSANRTTGWTTCLRAHVRIPHFLLESSHRYQMPYTLSLGLLLHSALTTPQKLMAPCIHHKDSAGMKVFAKIYTFGLVGTAHTCQHASLHSCAKRHHLIGVHAHIGLLPRDLLHHFLHQTHSYGVKKELHNLSNKNVEGINQPDDLGDLDLGMPP